MPKNKNTKVKSTVKKSSPPSKMSHKGAKVQKAASSTKIENTDQSPEIGSSALFGSVVFSLYPNVFRVQKNEKGVITESANRLSKKTYKKILNLMEDFHSNNLQSVL